MKIVRLDVSEVVVPARPGSINSPGLERPLHKSPWQGQAPWSVQFDTVPKAVIEAELDDGTLAYGECHRGHDRAALRAGLELLLDRGVRDLPRQTLAIPAGRELAGIECLVWDAVAKVHGLRVADLLGGPVRDRVRVSAWSGHRTTEDLGPLARRVAEAGYETLKLKCDLSDDVVAWSRHAATFAPGLELILDPNERWERLGDARRRIDQLAEVGNVACIEDPLPRWMMDDLGVLRRSTAVDIALHVALPYPHEGQRIEDAVLAVRTGAVDAFNFTAGPRQFRLLGHIAEAAGMPCWLGSEIDLGILEALYVHQAAATAACRLPSDIFGRLIREHDLLSEPLRLEPPYVHLPDGPGLGIEPDRSAIEHYAVSTWRVCP